MGQFGARKREKDKDKSKPKQQKECQIVFQKATKFSEAFEKKVGKRQKADDQNDDIVVKRSTMTLHGSIKSVQVMFQEKPVDKMLALGLVFEQIPGECDKRKEQKSDRIENRFHPELPLFLYHKKKQTYGKWDQNGDWSFGQKTQCHEDKHCIEIFSGTFLVKEIDTKHRQCNEKIQKSIGNRSFGDHVDLKA